MYFLKNQLKFHFNAALLLVQIQFFCLLSFNLLSGMRAALFKLQCNLLQVSGLKMNRLINSRTADLLNSELLYGWCAASTHIRCCRVISAPVICCCCAWRKVILSLSWMLTFVLIKARVLVPDRINWQVEWLHSVPHLHSPWLKATSFCSTLFFVEFVPPYVHVNSLK